MMARFIVLMSVTVVLAACGDKPQTAGGIKQDAAPYAGTGKPYVDRGWKEGDKVSWEQHLKARTQAGQNDYSKAN